MVKGIMHELGLYNSEEEAALIYNNTAKKLLGEYAWTSKLGG